MAIRVTRLRPPPGAGRHGVHDAEGIEDPDGPHLGAPGTGGVGDVAAGGGGQDGASQAATLGMIRPRVLPLRGGPRTKTAI